MASEQQNFSGAAVVTSLTTAINASTTTIIVASTSGYPASGLPFTVTIDQGQPTEETVFVRSWVGSTLTLDAAKGRGYDGTTAQAHNVGAAVVHTPDAAWFADRDARIFVRNVAVTYAATPAVNSDTTDVAEITGISGAITSMTTSLTGTPKDGQRLTIALTDNGTPQTIAWGAKFESSGHYTLPTTTVTSTRLDCEFIYNGATSKWRLRNLA